MLAIMNKIQTYGMSMFSYSNTSKLSVAVNMVRLMINEVLKKRYVIAPVNDYRMMLDLQTPGLSRTLFVYGTREIMDTYVVRKEVHGAMNVLEVGANIGYYAMMEARQLTTGKIYALEPDPRNQELLRKNAELNGCGDKLLLFPYAASDKNGTATLFMGKRTNVSSLVSHEYNGGSESIEVKVIKLDDFPEIDQIDFIRMDIEGYECRVLDGMREYLATHKRPLKIFIETHNHAYNDSDMNFTAQMRFLGENGFKVKYLISNAGYSPGIAARGYPVVGSGTELNMTRDLFENVSIDDAIEFVKKEMVRSLLFASGE